MANGIPGDLTRARTLGDILAEADASSRGVGRDRFVGINERGDDATRKALRQRLGPGGLAHLIDGGKIDPHQGRRIASLPARATSTDRATRSDADGYVGLAEGVTDVDDHATNADEFLAIEDERRARQMSPEGDGSYLGESAERLAAGKRVSGRKRSDRVGRAKPLTGETPEEAQERLLRDDGPKRRKPVMVSGRVTPEVSAALAGNVAAGAIIEAFGQAMLRTGANPADILRSLETGIFDPAVVDAVSDSNVEEQLSKTDAA